MTSQPKWNGAGAAAALLAVLATGAAGSVSTAQEAPAEAPAVTLVTYELSNARVRLSLPDWHVRTPDETRCIRQAATTGTPALDERIARAQETIDRSGLVSQIVLVRDPGRDVTPAVTLTVNPSDSETPVIGLMRRHLPRGQPGFVVFDGPRPLAIDGIPDAAYAWYLSRAGIRGEELRQAGNTLVQLRHAGHLVTLRLSTPLGLDQPPAIDTAVLASIGPLP